MRHHRLARLSQEPTSPQLGVFLIDGVPRFTTLEPPKVGDITCIPDGDYVCKRVLKRTTTGGLYIPETYLITDTPGKTGCLFHVGNRMENTTGCVLIAKGYEGKNYIWPSKEGFELWLRAMKNEPEFELSIDTVKL